MNTYGFTERGRIDLLESAMRRNHISPRLFPLDWLKSTDFFRAPAAAHHHSNYSGGLFDHSMHVAQELIRLTRNHTTAVWGRPESPFLVGILHDITKVGKYIRSDEIDPSTGKILSTGYTYNKEYEGEGHGQDSLDKLKPHIQLTEEEQLCIRYHMGAYETDDWDGYDKAIRMYPNVLWTHSADMIASKVMER